MRPPHTLAVLYWLGLLFFSLFISLLATLTGAVALREFPGCFGFLLLLWWVEDLRSRFYESVSLERYLGFWLNWDWEGNQTDLAGHNDSQSATKHTYCVSSWCVCEWQIPWVLQCDHWKTAWNVLGIDWRPKRTRDRYFASWSVLGLCLHWLQLRETAFALPWKMLVQIKPETYQTR